MVYIRYEIWNDEEINLSINFPRKNWLRNEDKNKYFQLIWWRVNLWEDNYELSNLFNDFFNEEVANLKNQLIDMINKWTLF